MRLKRSTLAAIGLALVAAAVPLRTAPTAAAPQPQAQTGGRGSIITLQPALPPAVGSGAISGVVTDAATKKPVAGALVRLVGLLPGTLLPLVGGPMGAPRPGQMTDASGRFIFTRLPVPAEYVLSARHPDYMGAGYNALPGESSARIALGEAQWFPNANIQLYRPAALSGTVVDERGEPVVGVPVRILKVVEIAGQVRRAIATVVETDDRGVYRAADLRPGSYVVHVPNVQITLADGAIRPPIAPQRPLAFVRAAGGVGAIVGHFPTAPPGRAYAMAYHPAARSAAEALPIALDWGETRTNADVQLALVPTVRVSGTLTGTPDAIANMPVWLAPAGDENSGAGGEVATTLSDPRGAFTFLNVPAGRYTLVASRSQSEYSAGGRGWDRLLPERGSTFNISIGAGNVAGTPGVAYQTQGRSGVAAFGRAPVVVEDRDVSNVVVPLASGVRLSGHFLWDGQPEAPAAVTRAPNIRLESADGDLSPGFPQSPFIPPSGEALPSPVPFTIDGVLPGRYLIGPVYLLGNFWVEGAEWRGRDLLATPLDVAGDAAVTGVVVRVTSKPTSVRGMVRDANGDPAASGAVVIFPASQSAWDLIGFSARRFASATIGARGTYVFTELPPGDYLVTAIADADRSRWLTREFLTTAAATATRVRVETGATIAQDLRMSGGRR